MSGLRKSKTRKPIPGVDPTLFRPMRQADARERLVAAYDHDLSVTEWATGYRWNIVLTGATSTPMES